MPNPRVTGISSITGKTVYIRHATESDMVDVQDYLKRHKQEERDLTRSDVVVAAEEDRIIGFGILEKAHDNDAGCATIVEDGRRRGIGASIVRHLMEYAPMKTVYSAAGGRRYFTRLGFTRTKTAQPEHTNIAARSMCRWHGKRGLSLTAYEKR
jgi:N-acetylglutamate synthase-like GNAT family acetyltransferase